MGRPEIRIFHHELPWHQLFNPSTALTLLIAVLVGGMEVLLIFETTEIQWQSCHRSVWFASLPYFSAPTSEPVEFRTCGSCIGCFDNFLSVVEAMLTQPHDFFTTLF